jgi:hypothetical protein
MYPLSLPVGSASRPGSRLISRERGCAHRSWGWSYIPGGCCSGVLAVLPEESEGPMRGWSSWDGSVRAGRGSQPTMVGRQQVGAHEGAHAMDLFPPRPRARGPGPEAQGPRPRARGPGPRARGRPGCGSAAGGLGRHSIADRICGLGMGPSLRSLSRALGDDEDWQDCHREERAVEKVSENGEVSTKASCSDGSQRATLRARWGPARRKDSPS